jgi:hypothetical protein
MAARLTLGFARSMDEELHMVHTRAFEPVCCKVVVSVTVGEAKAGTHSKDRRTLTRSQCLLDHSPPLAALVVGLYSGHGHSWRDPEIRNLGNWDSSWTGRGAGCILGIQGRSYLIYFHSMCSQGLGFAQAHLLHQCHSKVCHVEQGVVSIVDSLLRESLYRVRHC